MKNKKDLPNKLVKEGLIYILLMTIPLLYLSIKHNGLLYLFSWMSYFQTNNNGAAINVFPAILLILDIVLYYTFGFKQLICGLILRNEKDTAEYKDDIEYQSVSIKKTKITEIILYSAFFIIMIMQLLFDAVNIGDILLPTSN
jgi:hypothetical protein